MHADSSPLTGAERAWLRTRATATLPGAEIHAALAAGADGRIVLSSDPAASAVPAHRGADGVVGFAAEEVHVTAGQTLVLTSPDKREPMRVVFGALRLDAGGRVVVETPIELEAGRGVVDGPIELVGKDGDHGKDGPQGNSGTREQRTGGTGGRGGEGQRGEDGPGGLLWFGDLSGTLTVLAGGGNGGNGGRGGQGGTGFNFIGRGDGGRGGVGGQGGRGGDAGNGGSVVIAFRTLTEGGVIRPLARPNAPGRGGGPGPAGEGGRPTYYPGSPGTPGAQGNGGDAPAFSIRSRAER